MADSRQSARALPALVLAGFVAAFVFVGISAIVSHRYDATIQQTVEASREALKELGGLRELEHQLNDALSGARAYLLNGDSADLRRYTDAARSTDTLLRRVEEDVTREERSETERMTRGARERLGSLDRIVMLAQRGDREAAIAAAGTPATKQNELALEAAIDAERARLSGLHLALQATILRELQLAQTANWYAAIASLVVLLVAGGLMLRYLRERDEAADELQALNASLEETIRQRTADLSELSQHLLTVRDEERASLARDIHDEIGSELSALILELAGLKTVVTAGKPVAEATWSRIKGALQEMTAAHRRIINALHPAILEHLGLEAAVRTVVDEVAHRHDLACVLTVDGDLSALPSGVPIAAYRLVQEAVNNVVKHAHATCLDISLARSATALTVTVTDDGIGMESHAMTKGRLGLIGMRERAYKLGGSFDVGPGPAGRGTRLVAEFRTPQGGGEASTSPLHSVEGEQAAPHGAQPVDLARIVVGLVTRAPAVNL